MKPRIFVSSTFYDLKYVREDLSNFIKAHDFEPIMFEDGDIGYTPGKPLDSSCYETMGSSDMVILIIGGNYGSPATGEVREEFKEYMSVTRREFQTAAEAGIPIYCFVDGKVHAEYGVYEVNIEEIENGGDIKFKNVKDINVFRFIREIKNVGHISITEFDKLMEIKDFLSKQWSDMFKTYLGILKDNIPDKKLESTVNDMKLLIKKMDVMLDTVGKKILSDSNNEEYSEVIKIQEIMIVSSKIVEAFEFDKLSAADTPAERKEFIEKFLDILANALKNNIWDYFKNNEPAKFFDYFDKNGVDIQIVDDNFNKKIPLKFWDIVNTAEWKKELVYELIKDENYQKMITDKNEA